MASRIQSAAPASHQHCVASSILHAATIWCQTMVSRYECKHFAMGSGWLATDSCFGNEHSQVHKERDGYPTAHTSDMGYSTRDWIRKP